MTLRAANQKYSAFSFLRLLLRKHKLLAAVILSSFILGIAFAFINSDSYKLKTFLTFIDQMESIAQKPNVLLSILENNLRAAFMMQILGFFILFPVFILFTNGYILGLFADMIIRSEALTSSFRFVPVMVTSVVPHAVIELPAFILSGFTATLFGMKLFFPNKVEAEETRKRFFIKLSGLFLIIIVPLFIIAAGIEAYVTPTLAGAVETALFKEDGTKDLPASLLVQKEDLEHIAASDAMSSTRRVPGRFTWLIKLWGLFVYDNSLRVRFLTAHPVRSGAVDLSFFDNSFLWGSVAEFNSVPQAQIYQQAYSEALNKLSDLDDSITVFQNGNNWTLRKKEETFSGRSGVSGRYSYIFWYQGDNPRLLLAAAEMQTEKLLKQ